MKMYVPSGENAGIGHFASFIKLYTDADTWEGPDYD
jgi:hypothetical protein